MASGAIDVRGRVRHCSTDARPILQIVEQLENAPRPRLFGDCLVFVQLGGALRHVEKHSIPTPAPERGPSLPCSLSWDSHRTDCLPAMRMAWRVSPEPAMRTRTATNAFCLPLHLLLLQLVLLLPRPVQEGVAVDTHNQKVIPNGGRFWRFGIATERARLQVRHSISMWRDDPNGPPRLVEVGFISHRTSALAPPLRSRGG